MRSRLILSSIAVAALVAACAAPKTLGQAGKLTLDSKASSLSAIAIKNGKVPVKVDFPGLKGWARSDGQAELSIPLTKMSTGNEPRDANVKNYFFELGKDAGFATATFRLSKLDADVSGLADGQSLSATAQGSLSLHGAAVDLSGPLSFTRKGRSLNVSLGEGWAILIDKTSLVEPLKNLNKNCPQPHNVGNEVKLQGSLVFKL